MPSCNKYSTCHTGELQESEDLLPSDFGINIGK